MLYFTIVNGSPSDHKPHYTSVLQPGVCEACDINQFDDGGQRSMQYKDKAVSFSVITVLMFYSSPTFLHSHPLLFPSAARFCCVPAVVSTCVLFSLNP